MELTREEIAAVAERKREAYEAVIGLEVHVQLKTASKIFCACSTRFGDPPNTNVCPVCLGLPGTLPVLNRQAVALAVRAALALNCGVNPSSQFARKNYFYPDLPKGYQISQYDRPLAEQGWLEIEAEESGKRVGITRVHLEEDAGKSLHEGFPDSDAKTYLDFNRCGVALIEIVSEPDLRSPQEAYAYLTTLKQVLEYIEVSDCDMEKGSLRCDANVSVRRKGAQPLGVKTEVKNLNSFKDVKEALDYEISRQVAVLENGGRIEQETRLWNAETGGEQPTHGQGKRTVTLTHGLDAVLTRGRTEPMRSKEFAHDYRYFPEPDLLPLAVNAAWVEKMRGELPELPAPRRARLVTQYNITAYDAEVLTATRALADYFEAVARIAPEAKAAANWIQTELLGALKKAGKEIQESPVAPAALAELLRLVQDGTLSGKMGKAVFKKIFSTRRPARDILIDEGLRQIIDPSELDSYLVESIKENREQLDQIRRGKAKVRQFFVGDVMKRSRGQANPAKLNQQLDTILALEQMAVHAEAAASLTQEALLVKTLKKVLYPEVWKKSDRATTSSSSTQPTSETSTEPTSTGE